MANSEEDIGMEIYYKYCVINTDYHKAFETRNPPQSVTRKFPEIQEEAPQDIYLVFGKMNIVLLHEKKIELT